MNKVYLTKEQLLNIKDLLKTLNEKIPIKTRNSLVIANTINTTNIIFCIYSLIATDIEVQTIICNCTQLILKNIFH